MPDYGRRPAPPFYLTGRYFSAVADLAPGFIATIVQYVRLVSALEEADEMSEVNEIVGRHKEWIKSKEVEA